MLSYQFSFRGSRGVWGVPLFSPLGTQPSSLSNLFTFLLISLPSLLLPSLVCTCLQVASGESVCCYYRYLTVLLKYLSPFPLEHLWLSIFYYGLPLDVCFESSILYYTVINVLLAPILCLIMTTRMNLEYCLIDLYAVFNFRLSLN